MYARNRSYDWYFSSIYLFLIVPFNGPIGGVIVGRIDGQFIINPTVDQESKSDLYVVVAGTKDAIMMVEAEANEVPEAVMLEAIMFGHDEIKKIVATIEELACNCRQTEDGS